MENTRAVIMAGGKGTRLKVLTHKRAKPAVPFGGKYRIIDFALSNCVNSGIDDVLVLTQYRPHSLNEHIGKGRPWDLDRSFSGGIQLLQPYIRHSSSDWYTGTADAVYQNLNFVRRGEPALILILSGDHIYNMDYRDLINFHLIHGADATICTIEVPLEEASRFGIIEVDSEEHRIKSFAEKPEKPRGTKASMGVYLFNLDVLETMLKEDAMRDRSSRDFGKDIIPSMIEQGYNLHAFPYDQYWVDVGTVDAYWEAHMDLLSHPPELDLNNRSWVIRTRSEERPPVRIERNATVADSMITDGSVIAAGATVERSVLSPGVYVGPNAVVRESIILTDTYIEAGAVVERAVIDKNCVVGHNAKVGEITDGEGLGLVMVGKNTHIPNGIVIRRGVLIGPDLSLDDLTETEISEGVSMQIPKGL